MPPSAPNDAQIDGTAGVRRRGGESDGFLPAPPPPVVAVVVRGELPEPSASWSMSDSLGSRPLAVLPGCGRRGGERSETTARCGVARRRTGAAALPLDVLVVREAPLDAPPSAPSAPRSPSPPPSPSAEPPPPDLLGVAPHVDRLSATTSIRSARRSAQCASATTIAPCASGSVRSRSATHAPGRTALPTRPPRRRGRVQRCRRRGWSRGRASPHAAPSPRRPATTTSASRSARAAERVPAPARVDELERRRGERDDGLSRLVVESRSTRRARARSRGTRRAARPPARTGSPARAGGGAVLAHAVAPRRRASGATGACARAAAPRRSPRSARTPGARTRGTPTRGTARRGSATRRRFENATALSRSKY